MSKGRWERTKTIIYKIDTPAVQAPPWVKPPSEPAPETQFSEATREMPARAATVESDVTVPFMQSLISGMFALVISASCCLAFGWDWVIPPLAAGIVFCVAWFVLLLDHRNLLWAVETVTGRDLNHDGTIGHPIPPEQTLRVQVGLQNTTYFLDVPHDKAVTFARSVISGNSSISEAEWKDYFGGIKEFKVFRGQLLGAGLVQWKNEGAHAQGVELTPAGRQVFKRMAKLPPAGQ